MANKISLNIGGFNLIINTTEDEAHVRKLNETLNEDLKQILTQNPSASITNAALLCALDYLDRYDKATHNANNMRDQIKDYMSDASAAKLQFDDAVRKNTELSAEVENLRSRITKLASEGAAGSALEQSLRAELDAVRNELMNVRAQLNEQLQRNSAILSDFGILNNALKSKDAEISGLKGRMEEMSSHLLEADGMISRLRTEIEAVTASREQMAASLDEANSRAEELELRLKEAEEARRFVQPEPAVPVFDETPYEPEPQEFYTEPVYSEPAEPAAPAYEEPSFPFEEPAPEEPSFPEPEDDLTEDLEEEVIEHFEEAEEEALPIEEETEEPAPQEEPEEEEPRKDYRFFDYEDGQVEEDDGEVGVGDNFKTFGQMIAEERKQPGNSYEDANSGKLDDDSLPNLSWINDID